MSILENYKRFKSHNEEFKHKRAELQKTSDMELHTFSEDLELRNLRAHIEDELQELLEEGTILYKEIYEGNPTSEDLSRFLVIANQIIHCKDFISPDQIKAWRVFRDLVEAYKKSFSRGVTEE